MCPYHFLLSVQGCERVILDYRVRRGSLEAQADRHPSGCEQSVAYPRFKGAVALRGDFLLRRGPNRSPHGSVIALFPGQREGDESRERSWTCWMAPKLMGTSSTETHKVCAIRTRALTSTPLLSQSTHHCSINSAKPSTKRTLGCQSVRALMREMSASVTSASPRRRGWNI